MAVDADVACRHVWSLTTPAAAVARADTQPKSLTAEQWDRGENRAWGAATLNTARRLSKRGRAGRAALKITVAISALLGSYEAGDKPPTKNRPTTRARRDLRRRRTHHHPRLQRAARSRPAHHRSAPAVARPPLAGPAPTPRRRRPPRAYSPSPRRSPRHCAAEPNRRLTLHPTPTRVGVSAPTQPPHRRRRPPKRALTPPTPPRGRHWHRRAPPPHTAHTATTHRPKCGFSVTPLPDRDHRTTGHHQPQPLRKKRD